MSRQVIEEETQVVNRYTVIRICGLNKRNEARYNFTFLRLN